jgi:hypothetical protein
MLYFINWGLFFVLRAETCSFYHSVRWMTREDRGVMRLICVRQSTLDLQITHFTSACHKTEKKSLNIISRYSILSQIVHGQIDLNPWSGVLLEKLTVPQLVKNFPLFYGTRKFITALTRPANCPYLQPDQSSSYSPHSSPWRSILILSFD